ncbi:MAG: hypothetical protein KatS3mg115_1033 [Candidatus Poribacteria bacterium]|nr:MAG: hypothetical protein KatS3mg115_1033 [Candidatus Poribacteria bacterium]
MLAREKEQNPLTVDQEQATKPEAPGEKTAPGQEQKSSYRPQFRMPQELISGLEIRESEIPGRIDWKELFGNDRPVETDIGFGKGRFLIEAAQTFPDRNFFGIELMWKPYRVARERLAKRRLPNVRIVRADAKWFVAERIPDRSVAVHHILFPDPWPKRRHHKRRLVTPPFVEELARTLIPGGVLHLASDMAEYFEELTYIVESAGRFELIAESTIDPERDILTNFAAKYLREGRELYQARFRLVGEGSG